MSDEAMKLRVEGVLSTDPQGRLLHAVAEAAYCRHWHRPPPRATPESGALDVRWMCAVECRRVRLVGLSIS